jgi:hypothetical protein
MTECTTQKSMVVPTTHDCIAAASCKRCSAGAVLFALGLVDDKGVLGVSVFARYNCLRALMCWRRHVCSTSETSQMTRIQLC